MKLTKLSLNPTNQSIISLNGLLAAPELKHLIDPKSMVLDAYTLILNHGAEALLTAIETQKELQTLSIQWQYSQALHQQLLDQFSSAYPQGRGYFKQVLNYCSHGPAMQAVLKNRCLEITATLLTESYAEDFEAQQAQDEGHFESINAHNLCRLRVSYDVQKKTVESYEILNPIHPIDFENHSMDTKLLTHLIFKQNRIQMQFKKNTMGPVANVNRLLLDPQTNLSFLLAWFFSYAKEICVQTEPFEQQAVKPIFSIPLADPQVSALAQTLMPLIRYAQQSMAAPFYVQVALQPGFNFHMDKLLAYLIEQAQCDRLQAMQLINTFNQLGFTLRVDPSGVLDFFCQQTDFSFAKELLYYVNQQPKFQAQYQYLQMLWQTAEIQSTDAHTGTGSTLMI